MLNDQEITKQSKMYCQDLYRRWQKLDFRGIMHVNMDSRINIPLEDIFVIPDVLPIVPDFETLAREDTPRIVNMKFSLRNEQRQYEENGHREGREDFLQMLENSSSLVILGDPGAGKTTLLRYLLLQLVNRTLGRASILPATTALNAFLPLYIPLTMYASAYDTHSHYSLDTFLPSLLKEYGLEQYTDLLRTLIGRKHVVFLLDGLDELANTDLRRTIVGELMDFTRTHEGNYFLVTSRIVGYKNMQLEHPYKAYTIADFTDEQIWMFIEKWCPAYEYWVNAEMDNSILRENAQKETLRLFQAIQRDPGVQKLAINPLLLTILALIQRQGIELPAHRVELFDLCVNTLIDTWLRAKGYLESSRLSKNDLFKLLRPLAFWMHDKLAASTAREADLQEQIREQLKSRNMRADEAEITQMMERFLGTVRGKTGVLIERGEEQYGFLHQTFQEYFAARELIVHRRREQLIRDHLHDPHWREVILLAAGTIGILQNDENGVTYLVQEVILKAHSRHERWLHRDLLMCGFCLADDIGISSNCEYIILSEILYLYLTSPFSSLRSRFVDMFSRWHGTRIAQETQKLIVPLLSKQAMLTRNDEPEVMALPETTQFEQRILTHYQRLIHQHRHALEQIVRLQILVILHRLKLIEDDKIHVDEDALLCDVSWQVRKVAVSLLAELGFSESDLTKVLLTALHDPHTEVRRAAAKALRKRETDQNRVIGLLRSAQSDPDPGVRKAVTTTLEYLKSDKEHDTTRAKEPVLSGLSGSSPAQDDRPPVYREDRSLTDAWLALDDPNAEKRRSAIMRLVSAKVKEKQVLASLRNDTFFEDHSNVEDYSSIGQAISFMLRQLKPVSTYRVPEILRDLAYANPDSYVREIAIIILGQLSDTQSSPSEILHDLMQFDPDPYVREAAVVIIGQSDEVQPQLLVSLQTLARNDYDPHVREAAIIVLKQLDNAQLSSLDSLLFVLANLETNPDTKTTRAAIEELCGKDPSIGKRLKEMALDDKLIKVKELVRKPAGVYRQQIYIESLMRNMQLLKYLGSDQKQVLETLLTLLTSPNEDIRRVTISTLARLGATDAQVVHKLIDMLSDPVEVVRNEAVNVLGELGKMHHSVLEEIVKSLKENLLVDKRAIAEVLKKCECTEDFVIHALLSLLASSASSEAMLTSHPSDDRQAVIETLAHLGSGNEKVLQELLGALNDPDFSVRSSAVFALGRLGKGRKNVGQELLKALSEKSPSVRQSAATALGQIAWERDIVINELLDACKDSDLQVRKAAVLALIQIGSDHPRVQAELAEEFVVSVVGFKRELALAFAQLRQVDAVFIPMLLRALRDDDPSVQGNVALALGKIDDNRSKKIQVCHELIEAFNHVSANHASASIVKSDILLALGKISGNDDKWSFVHEVLTNALNETDPSVRYNAALSLARQNSYPPAVISVLLLSLLDAEAPIRQEAITLLSHAVHNQDEVIEKLRSGSGDNQLVIDQLVRERDKMIEAMLPSLSDIDQSVREAAANSLTNQTTIGRRLAQRLEGYKGIVDKQLIATSTIEATLSALQRAMGDIK